ncbi:MAG: GH3 auxin-responsive promoter family protein [Acidobacteriota bacterium]|nr:GH3 auxin-responsive promoter family protein [Acidobacteriota bacterium]
MRAALRGLANDAGRFAIAALLRLAGWAVVLRHRVRLSFHPLRERRLRRRFGIDASTAVTRDLPKVEAEGGAGTSVALTSGTAGEPKRVPYSRRRLAATRAVFVDGMLRLIAARRVRRPSLYVFGALDPDRSLSSLLVRERRAPAWFVLLQAPYRAQSDPALLELKERYGACALRLLVLTLANPGMLYATNPSTLSAFLEEVEGDWGAAAALVRRVVRDPQRVAPGARRILRRLASRGWRDRLARVAESASPLPITAWNPACTTYVCWTGGAVTPFLERLDRRLPAPRFRREPMYSMSTETVATIPDYRRAETAFLPAAPGVVHEFVAEPGTGLVNSRDLVPGRTYEMVVSHRFGLRRYATGDRFRVARFVGGLPDLRFVGRRGLGWSFTGEKLTAEQVGQALRTLEAEHPGLREGRWLALFPSNPGGAALPCYRLAAVGGDSPGLPGGLPERLDELLGELNVEYRAKRAGGRLGEVRLSALDRAQFLRRATGGGPAHPDSQFKFQPFYPRLWEE